jgi:type VI secretion system protein VasJ
MSEADQPASDLLPQAIELAAPISAALPVGEDPKYSTEFEFVKSEIAKMSERDWEQIAAASRKVLLSQAKDITLFCYHMLAGTMSRGWGEGAAAAQALSVLMAEHWDTIHPQRDRARQNAFKWLVEERTTGTFAQVAHTMEDHESLAAFALALGRIRDLIEQKFPENPPSLKPLQQMVEEKAKATRPVFAPAAAPANPGSNPSSGSGSHAASSGPAPTVADGASKGDLMMALQKIALQMSASDPASPVGWKLLRTCRWQELTALPKNEGGKTAFAAPNPARVSFLEGQFAQKSWGTILEKSETIFTEPGLHLWFDLQHWVVEALAGRGQEPCAQAVREELRGLLKRVPGLPDLKFADGSPVASVQTRDWLDQIAREGGPGDPPVPPPPAKTRWKRTFWPPGNWRPPAGWPTRWTFCRRVSSTATCARGPSGNWKSPARRSWGARSVPPCRSRRKSPTGRSAWTWGPGNPPWAGKSWRSTSRR